MLQKFSFQLKSLYLSLDLKCWTLLWSKMLYLDFFTSVKILFLIIFSWGKNTHINQILKLLFVIHIPNTSNHLNWIKLLLKKVALGTWHIYQYSNNLVLYSVQHHIILKIWEKKDKKTESYVLWTCCVPKGLLTLLFLCPIARKHCQVSYVS